MLHARRRQNAAGPYYPRLKIPGLRRRIRVSAAMGWQRPPGFAPRPPQEPVGPSPPRLRPDCYLARPIEYPHPPLKGARRLKHAPRRARRRGGSTQHAWLSSDGKPAQSEYEKRIAWLQQTQIAPDCKTEGRPARPMAASEPSGGGSAGRQPGCYIPSAAVTGFLHYLLFRGRSRNIRAAGGSLALAKL